MRRIVHHLRQRLLDRAVLRPSRHAIDAGEQIRHEIQLPMGRLEFFTQKVKSRVDANHRWIVLKFPGTGGRAERSSVFPLDLIPGVDGEVWTINFPGYGRSEGRATLLHKVDVADRFLQHAFEHLDAPDTSWLLCGNSLGCLSAMGLAARISEGRASVTPQSVRLILRNVPPLADVVRRVASTYPLGRLFHSVASVVPDELNALMTAQRITLPAVFLVSGNDTLVPPSLQQQVHAAFAGPHRTVVLDDLEHDGLLNREHRREIADALEWLVTATP